MDSNPTDHLATEPRPRGNAGSGVGAPPEPAAGGATEAPVSWGLYRSLPALAAFYLVALAVLARMLVVTDDPALRAWYVGLHGVFFLLYALCWCRRLLPALRGTIFVLQCTLVLALLALEPARDFVTALFVVLAYQGTLVFSGRARALAVGLCVLLTGVSLMVGLGPLRGLALALIPMAAAIVLSAYAVATAELEAARAESERVVADLEATKRRLEAYAGEVEALAGMEERNRLARELHDSVSQTLFGVQLLTSSARMLLQSDPDAARPQLERLQEQTKTALSHMRSLITDLDGGTGRQ
ncbi:MAG: sensor histidine kinase [Thermoleophilia bacterium]